MQRTITAVCVSVFVAAVSVGSSWGQPGDPPSKVTGGSVFLDLGADGISGSLEPYSFNVNINPDKKAGKNSPQAVVQVDGPGLQDFWGGPLLLRDDFAFYYPIPFELDDPKPGQAFLFMQEHPIYGWVAIWVFAHDNVTPGFNTENPGWSDWFGIWIELPGGNGSPNGGVPGLEDDDLFVAIGTVIHGNIMDHRD